MLYGDTDSLFVESGAADATAARSLRPGARGAASTRELAAHIQERWRVESRLELVFDRLYLRLCLPAMRNDAAGARKRYAGPGRCPRRRTRRVHGHGGRAQRLDRAGEGGSARAVHATLRATQPVEEYLREVVASLRAGQLDDRLVYRKALRKPPEAYTTTTPPHVAVARQTGQKRRGRIAYVITTARPAAGRRPARALSTTTTTSTSRSAPVAEPVLTLLGLDLEQILGSRKQLRLF